MQVTAEQELARFVMTQKRLVETYVELNGPMEGILPARPQAAYITVDGVEWDLRRHGAGVSFVERGGRRKVDVHDRFDAPNLVDAWRLVIYFGGLGRQGEKMLRRSGQPANEGLDKRIGAWLDTLVRAGILATDGRHFWLLVA